MRRNPGDDELRRLEREWLATGDAGIEQAYLAAWQRAGAPGRDPRRDPLPGDVVDCNTTSRWSRAGNDWSEVRRYEVVAVWAERCRAVSTMGAPAMCTLHAGHENERGGTQYHRWPREGILFTPLVRRRLLARRISRSARAPSARTCLSSTPGNGAATSGSARRPCGSRA